MSWPAAGDLRVLRSPCPSPVSVSPFGKRIPLSCHRNKVSPTQSFALWQPIQSTGHRSTIRRGCPARESTHASATAGSRDWHSSTSDDGTAHAGRKAGGEPR